MTEAQWLQCEVPGLMLNAVASEASERKLRLFAAACWRRVPRVGTDAGCARAVAVAEQYADWLVHDDVLDQARQVATTRSERGWGKSQYEVLLSREMTASLASAAAYGAAWELQAKALSADKRLQRQARRKGAPPGEAESTDVRATPVEEYQRQCALLRDLFAPFFALPSWTRTGGRET
jgi:hypothetical protein